MNRRDFIKSSLGGITLLFGGVAGYQLYLESQERPFEKTKAIFLTEADQLVLSVLIPVILNGATDKIDLIKCLENIDGAIIRLPQKTQQELRQLFDLLGSVFGRLVIAGVWQNWQTATSNSLNEFLESWRNSSLDLLQQAYLGLHKLIIGSFYSEQSSWAAIGYPGPLSIQK
ncbi:MAG: hypothetical protein OQK51_21935 [Kangiellaceae bacterium]|nr:hypothetical protein [Kangiellaceae bacterium]